MSLPKGLPTVIPGEEIIDDIKAIGYKVQHVARVAKTGQRSDAIRVRLAAEKKSESFKKVAALCYLKCPGARHYPDCVEDTTDPDFEPYCQQCSTKGHRATYRGCIEYRDYEDKQLKNQPGKTPPAALKRLKEQAETAKQERIEKQREFQQRAEAAKIWKEAIVKVLLKPGKDPSKPASYRPISLLSTLSKLYERCILDFILEEEEHLGVLPPEQFGFRSQHSTVLQLARILDYTVSSAEAGETTVMAALDLEAAFDRVPPEELILKLQEQGFSSQIVLLVKNFVTGRSLRVRVKRLCHMYDEILQAVQQLDQEMATHNQVLQNQEEESDIEEEAGYDSDAMKNVGNYSETIQNFQTNELRATRFPLKTVKIVQTF
ncbi:uncharacterized protein LOC117652058 [Thrips palmi]|uniref:Uncharacterized protein LOC117652058 n=1 Tax=Thrips palmi TaxID=161013 RepID=A0A6P9A5R9_THRPL|nr:uncharacterized protein LOC117652058 [Thrips palmi]